MSVLIRVGATKAIFRNGTWVSCDRALEVRLNGVTASWIEQTGGPALHDPDPEKACAAAVTQMVGGSVLRHLPSLGPRTRDIFVSKRQMSLMF
jgi:hypothetical protein